MKDRGRGEKTKDEKSGGARDGTEARERKTFGKTLRQKSGWKKLTPECCGLETARNTYFSVELEVFDSAPSQRGCVRSMHAN
jgi:hypothetical protein